MKRSESIKELTAALAKAQAKIKNAEKDRSNEHFGQGYATLASVWEAVREPLSSNGLAIIQSPSTVDGGIKMTTLLSHQSGEWIEDELVLFPKDRSPQAAGSAITYSRRYSLMSFAGLAPGENDEDEDDGNGATFGARRSQASGQQRPAGNKPAVQPKGASPAAPLPAGPSPEQPKAPPAEQQPAKATDPRTEALGQLVDPVKWPKGSVAEYTKLRYGTAKVSELKEDQFAQLIATIKLMTSSQAKADAKAFLAAQEAEQAKATDWAKNIETNGALAGATT